MGARTREQTLADLERALKEAGVADAPAAL